MNTTVLSKYFLIATAVMMLAACGDDYDEEIPDFDIPDFDIPDTDTPKIDFTPPNQDIPKIDFTPPNQDIPEMDFTSLNLDIFDLGTVALNTTITSPIDFSFLINANVRTTTVIEFSFNATETEATFECSLDSRPFTPCSSPVKYKDLTEGSHTFKVRATDKAGNTDPTPAIYQWTVELNDPLYEDQWHLKNRGQAGNDKKRGTVGEDINVEPVWNSCTDDSCRGEGVRIVVVDYDLEIGHEDLRENVVSDKSYNYVDGSADPSASLFSIGDGHGTSVSGIIAARDLNGVGVRGVAPRAGLIGYNLLQALTSENESDAMTRDAAQNHISNNSWGVPDSTGRIIDSTDVWRKAIDTGHRIGREGQGTVYVWAAGNGHEQNSLGTKFLDNSNYDGYANYRGVIAVGAVNNSGQRSSYSEQGANLLVSAPGGEICDTHAVVTTDRTGWEGYNSNLFWLGIGTGDNYYNNNNYTACFKGTSAAAPMVSGVVALILQANPSLGWRDVHAILARSARKNDPLQSDWKTNGAGLHVNHNYGFGVVDAEAAVLLAKNWINLSPEKKFSTSLERVDKKIGDNDGSSVRSTLSVASSGITNIEFIEIRFSADDHPYLGDLEIILVNQSTGTTSRLAEKHVCKSNICGPSYKNWRFGSTRHLGESADGDWQLIVRDKEADDEGTFQSWKLTFYGT